MEEFLIPRDNFQREYCKNILTSNQDFCSYCGGDLHILAHKGLIPSRNQNTTEISKNYLEISPFTTY
jgi:hypothetical protein